MSFLSCSICDYLSGAGHWVASDKSSACSRWRCKTCGKPFNECKHKRKSAGDSR